MRVQTARAWGVALVALLVAGAGLSWITAGSSVTSLWRMAVGAGVLSAYAAVAALVATDRAQRSRRRCLIWGATVPIVVGLVNAALVTAAAGPGRGTLSALPWLVGSLLVSCFGTRLPGFRFPRRTRPALH